MNRLDRKNMIFFGLGTVGRDMFYALEANALIYYLSNVLHLPTGIFLAASIAYTVLRIFDALNDPLMGLIVDNGRSKYGKFKPPMLLGALASAACYMLFFTDFGLKNYWFVAIFAIAYILWDIFYGLNDIAYWSMLPSLSLEQKTREKMGAFARICANVGMFAIMVGWQPLTISLSAAFGKENGEHDSRAWFIIAAAVTVFMILFQLFTIFGVKEKNIELKKQEKTSIRGMFSVICKNDQLLWTTLSMSLFTIGYMTTTTSAVYYMQYVYGDAAMYAVLAAVVGVAQLSALVIFPLVSKHFTREKLYLYSTVLVIAGYIVFFFADKSLALIAVSALLIFIGEAFIQLLMLMFLTDTVEYGQWKLGKRNESITLSVQPFINKIGGALSTGFVSLAVVWSGIKKGEEAAVSIDSQGQLILKLVMLLIPLVLIVAGYIVYRCKFKIDKQTFDNIICELKARGELDTGEASEK